MKLLTILLGLLYFIKIDYSQEFAIQVILDQNKDIKTVSINNNRTLTALVQKYGGKEFLPCYPGAKTPELAYYYYIIGTNEPEGFVAELKGTNLFESVELQEKPQPLTCTQKDLQVNDSLYDSNDPRSCWWLKNINAACAWDITKGNPSILVGLVEADYDITHVDLQNKISRYEGIKAEEYKSHGTSTAGCAAGHTNNYKGLPSIGYNTRIAAQCVGENYLIWVGIWELHQAGVPIINASMAWTGLAVAAAREIVESGKVLIVSAGNDSTDICHSSIADIPGVINVSSVDEENSSRHARNQWVDLCAPGCAVKVLVPGDGYVTAWGTSLSAPIVSGTVALMLDVNPLLTPAKVESILKSTTEPITGAHLYPGQVGTGRLNAYKAVKKAGSRDMIYYWFPTGIHYLSAGYGFSITNSTVYENTNVILEARKEVEILRNFEVPLGSVLEIRINESARNNGGELITSLVVNSPE